MRHVSQFLTKKARKKQYLTEKVESKRWIEMVIVVLIGLLHLKNFLEREKNNHDAIFDRKIYQRMKVLIRHPSCKPDYL